jgi:hypothetical protein
MVVLMLPVVCMPFVLRFLTCVVQQIEKPAKKEMKVEMWTFHGDGTTWVNATSIYNYMYAGATEQVARAQKNHFKNHPIPHKVLDVQGVYTRFFNLYQ